MPAGTIVTRLSSGCCRTAFFVTVLLAGSYANAQEYRAFWVDGWGAGFLNQTQVTNLLGEVGNASSLGTIRSANCNAVIVQVRRRFDTCYPSGIGEPYMSGLSPSNFNALQAMIDAAHDTTGGKKRIEVHCWMVAFATNGGTVWSAHNDKTDADNYWATEDSSGNWTDDYAFDPGHPKCLEYITNAAMDVVNRFDIDGIHWDYIRFTANNQGYNPTSIARYNTRYGLTGTPASTTEQFKQWRRDQVSALVRRVYAKIQTAKPNVKHSGAFVTWNPSPTSSTRAAFMATRPYYDVYSDWDSWLQEGIVDIAVPMTYYNWASLPTDYTRWMNFEKDRHGNRFMVIGPGTYLNSLSNAILELQMTRNASTAGNYAQGFSGYCYRVPYSSGTWAGFSPTLVSDVTPTWADVPTMSWKTAPTKGHISGTVTYYFGGEWADGATVTISGPETRTMYVDGTGFYAFIDVTPGTYTITASKAGYTDVSATATVSIGQVTGNMYVRDLQLGGTSAPAISNVSATNITASAAVVNWATDQPATSQVEYGTTTSYGTTTTLDSTLVTSHTATLSGLSASTLYHFRVISTSENGTTTSGDYTFSTNGPPTISDAQVTSITTNGATITWTTTAPATSQVAYGTTSSYGSLSTLNSANVTSHAVALTGLTANTTYHCQALSSNTYGSVQSSDLTFTTLDPASEIVIDNLDTGCTKTGSWSTGSSSVVPKIGTNYLYKAGTGSTDESSITATVRWTPEIPGWGTYDVYVYYQMGTNRTTGAYYKVVYADGQLTSVQNQYSTTANQGGWFLVGENLRFTPGTAGYVELGNNAPDALYVSADAAKFVYKGSDPTEPSTPVVTDDGAYTASWTSLHATWSASDSESGVAGYEYRVVDSGGTVVRDWTEAGTATDFTATGLSLMIGDSYIINVRATNGAGVVSAVGSSDGIRVFTFDADGSGKIDDTDTTAFLACLSGPGTPYPAAQSLDCGRFDTERDGDVDVEDYGIFQLCLTGDQPADPTCLK
jgi:uncharacterized lipoprotein YddW (UPF0748 family)